MTVPVGQNDNSRFLVREAEGAHKTSFKEGEEGSTIKCEEQLVLNLDKVFKIKSDQHATTANLGDRICLFLDNTNARRRNKSLLVRFGSCPVDEGAREGGPPHWTLTNEV